MLICLFAMKEKPPYWGQMAFMFSFGKVSVTFRVFRVSAHLKGLEGQAHMVALGDRDLPHTHFVGPVVVWVVGGLDLPVVLSHLTTADS